MLAQLQSSLQPRTCRRRFRVVLVRLHFIVVFAHGLRDFSFVAQTFHVVQHQPVQSFLMVVAVSLGLCFLQFSQPLNIEKEKRQCCCGVQSCKYHRMSFPMSIHAGCYTTNKHNKRNSDNVVLPLVQS